MMSASKNVQELTISLEDVLVREFRTLQSLVTVTNQERQALTKNEASALMPLVEEKEAILDSLSLLEESRRMLTEDISENVGGNPSATGIGSILSNLEPLSGKRISRLSEGISALVSEARDLNQGNRALAISTLTWLDSAQTFLLSFYSTTDTYTPPGMKPSNNTPSIGAINHIA
jgi:flagellar biosynthesis/type III secretory pathway chaperone